MIGLIYLNQVLFTIYVLRVHDGNPSFIARHVPEGWFTLADGSLLESLAQHFPAPELLAPSVLRVNAFLELPFVVLSYLTVCRWFSPWTYQRAMRLVWPMSLSCTATFCLIEWRLYNQYTVQDTVVRIVATLIVPRWVANLSPAGSPSRTDSLPGLLAFVASTVGLGMVVLVVYDTALLYNLGHLDTQIALAAIAIVVVAAARTIVARVPDPPPGRGIHSIARTTSWLLVLAAVPALPLRYGLGFGAPRASVAGAMVLFTAALALGVRGAFASTPGSPARWLGQMTAVAASGLGVAAATAMLVHAQHTETRLLAVCAAGFLTGLLVCAGLDRLTDSTHTNTPTGTADARSDQLTPEGTGQPPDIHASVSDRGSRTPGLDAHNDSICSPAAPESTST